MMGKYRLTSSLMFSFIFLIFALLLLTCKRLQKEDYLLRFSSADESAFGYISTNGDTVIPVGMYTWCFTDTFRTMAIVAKSPAQIIAIDREQRELYEVFIYDNGPDYASDGLFRILKNGKIGYAATNGRVVIEPQFSCAFPFENGRAKVSLNCRDSLASEHRVWYSEQWFYIDRTGQPLAIENSSE